MSDLDAHGYGRLGQIIKDWMDAQPVEVRVAGVAKALGRARGTVGKWMKAESVPGPEDLNALSQLIDVPTRRLLEAIWLDKGYRINDLHPEAPRTTRAPKRSAG